VGISLTPGANGRLEIYLDGEKIFDRKEEAGKYPDLARVRQLTQVIKARLDALVAADSSRTSSPPHVPLQLFQSFQEGLKACAHPTSQPSVRRTSNNWGSGRERRIVPRQSRVPPLEHRPEMSRRIIVGATPIILSAHINAQPRRLRAVIVFSPKTIPMKHDSMLAEAEEASRRGYAQAWHARMASKHGHVCPGDR